MRRLNHTPTRMPAAPATSISTMLTSDARCACAAAPADTEALSAAIFLQASPSRRAGSRSMPATAVSPAPGSKLAALNASKPLR